MRQAVARPPKYCREFVAVFVLDVRPSRTSWILKLLNGLFSGKYVEIKMKNLEKKGKF